MPLKSCTCFTHPHLRAYHAAKFRWSVPTTAKVIGTYLLNFEPILDPSLKKIVGGTTFLNWGALVRLLFCSMCKNLGMQHPLRAEIWFSEKSPFGWVWFHLYIPIISGPKFIGLFFVERGRRNRGRSNTCSILNIHMCSRDICHQSLKSSKIRPNFARSWPLKFFGGGPPKFWTGIIKSNTLLSAVQKFCSERLRELGDLAAKKEKIIAIKI